MSRTCVPPDWSIVRLDSVAEIQTGLAKGKSISGNSVSLPYLRVANVQDGHLDLSEIKYIDVTKGETERYLLREGDVLFTEGGDFDKLGRGTVWRAEIPVCLHQNHIFSVRPNKQHLQAEYLAYLASSSYGRRFFQSASKQSTNLASINSSQLRAFPVISPPVEEQGRIVACLKVWDQAVALYDALSTQLQKQHVALTNQLVFGGLRIRKVASNRRKTKYRWFALPSDWQCGRIGRLAHEVSERNSEDESAEILSCSKYDGFVRSLDFFKRQVFSSDLTGYKRIYRGDFGFPSNHVEEGSIGLQNIVDIGLVSPIYTVFRFSPDKIDSEFAYYVLKTGLYRHIFEASTSASVDRRGSLRWNEFATIQFPVPSLQEQREIVELLHTSAKRLSALREEKSLLERQKRGLMQKLLTGEWRVNADGGAA